MQQAEVLPITPAGHVLLEARAAGKCQKEAGAAVCRTRGLARGQRVRGARGREQGDAERCTGAVSTHVWGWELSPAEHLLSLYITGLMAFNGRLCKRSGIGTKGAGGIIILTRGAKEHGKIVC